MKKTIIALALTSAIGGAQAETVNTTLLNVRSAPGTGGSVINQLPKGSEVTIYASSENWVKIHPQYDHWVNGKLLKSDTVSDTGSTYVEMCASLGEMAKSIAEARDNGAPFAILKMLVPSEAPAILIDTAESVYYSALSPAAANRSVVSSCLNGFRL